MTWAVEEKGYSQRRACGLLGLHPKTYRYASKRTGDEELRGKLRDLASQRRRFNEHLFISLGEAREIIEEWRIDYNTNRPHTSLAGLTPTEFAARPREGQNWNRFSL